MCEATRFSALVPLVIVVAVLSSSAHAAVENSDDRIRYEVAIGIHGLPGLAELQPASQGDFDEVGLNLGGAVHWPTRHVGNHKLRLGFDIGLFANGSNILFVSDHLILRGAYLVPSIKWEPGASDRFSLDAGLGFYLIDIAEVAGDYPWLIETEIWEQSGFGGYFGVTRDFMSTGGARNRGLMVSFKVHFFDLGTVRDEDPGLPLRLGTDAGKLDRGMYTLQLGYRWE